MGKGRARQDVKAKPAWQSEGIIAERMTHLGEAHLASGVAEPGAAQREVEVPQEEEEVAQEQDVPMDAQAEAEEAMDERALQDEHQEEAEREALVVAA